LGDSFVPPLAIQKTFEKTLGSKIGPDLWDLSPSIPVQPSRLETRFLKFQPYSLIMDILSLK
jgi:hypothetical protein